jgi:N,N'-diacetylchitobiose transport system substrate-binding protein
VKRNRLVATTVASTITLALALSACGSGGGDNDAASSPTATGATGAPEPGDITLWLNGADTPQELRDYLKTTFEKENPGSTLTIEEQSWTDLVPKLTTALADPENTPDVVEIGNTQAPTFSTVGAFREISSDLFNELGGSKLLPSFVAAGDFDGKHYALPYYFGSRYMFYRKDVWTAAGKEVPKTLSEFDETVKALRTDKMSGFAIGGQDWRNGISWIFANGGELATVNGTEWTSTLSDPKSIKGLQEWQDLFKGASNLPTTAKDEAYWDFINDGEKGAAPTGATIMAPSWARWSIGDMTKNDKGEEVRDGMKDDTKFDIFALPGVDGGVAPVFAGGSNIGISAKSKHPELSENLLRIIFSADFQKKLGGAGLGPANSDFASSLGDDKFAQTAIETAQASKLTPAAPGWAAVEGALVYEELFQKIAEGGDVTELAKQYDAKITPMLNAG